MDKIIEIIFSDISNPVTLLFILIVIAYLLFKGLWNNRENIKKSLEKYYQLRKRKEDLYNTVDNLQQSMNDIIAETQASNQFQKDFYNKQSGYRQQSQELRDQLEKKTDIAIDKSTEANERSKETLAQITEIYKLIEKIQLRQEELDAARRAQKVNELRTYLLNSFRYFTSLDNNPEQSWNEMEAHAFWAMFRDYEELGGNDYVHKIVQPAMNKLKVVPLIKED